MDDLLQSFQKKIGQEPYAQKLGMKLVDVQLGYSKVEMEFTSDLKNMFGMAHGGAIFSLMDEAFEFAANSHGITSVALSMNINYVRSPKLGDILVAEAFEVNRSRKIANYDIKVKNDSDELLATCQAIVYRKGDPISFL